MRLSVSALRAKRFYTLVSATALLCAGGLTHAAGVPGQGTWETTLQPRDLSGDGVTDAYYDTVLDITWLADADYKATSAWDNAQANGGWPEEEFADYVAGFGHLGVGSWRLPAINNPNQGSTGGELAHLYLVTLGNTVGALTNTGPFSNLVASCYLYNTGVSRGGLGGDLYANAYAMGSCPNFPGKAWVVANGDVQALQAPAPAYEVIDLGTLGGTYSRANDINNSGQIVGSASSGTSTVERAFLYSNGVMQDIGTLMPDNSGRSVALGINNLGQITGTAAAINAANGIGFLYSGGQMTPLGPLPASDYGVSYVAAGRAINDSGVIATSYFDPNAYETRFAVRAANGDLTIDNLRLGYAIDINAAGHAIGSQQNYGEPEQKMLYANDQFSVIASDNFDYYSATVMTARVYAITDDDKVAGSFYDKHCGSNFCDPVDSYGRITNVATLPVTASSHTKIFGTRAIHLLNAQGDMVGKYANRWLVRPANGHNVFLDAIIDTSAWNWSTAQLSAMNDQGDIVGSAQTTGGQTHAILLRRLAAQTVAIDVDPFSPANEVFPSSDNPIPVAILSTSVAAGDAADFDATQVDPASLKFGLGEAANIALPWAVDVGNDGDTDMLFGFRTQDAGIFCGDTEVSLTGATYSGQPIQGMDTIVTSDCETTGCHP